MQNNRASILAGSIVVVMVVVSLYFAIHNNKKQQTKSDVTNQTATMPSIMELSAIKHKDTVKYSENGYTLRTITIESFVYDEDENSYIKEENGPHFTLGSNSNLNETSIGSTFDCMLQRDDTGFTSGITVSECVQR